MRIALELALKGAGYVSPNPMVGAVIVKDISSGPVSPPFPTQIKPA